MFDRDSRSVVRSLIGLFTFRSNPVSKVYQHRSRNDHGILEVTWSTGSLRKNCKKLLLGSFTPDPFPQLANGTGPNRTRAQWKFTNVYLDSTRNIYPVHMCTTFIIIGGSIISLSRPYPARDTRYRWIYKRCSIVVSVSE